MALNYDATTGKLLDSNYTPVGDPAVNPTISKIKIGDTTYLLKDADVRAILANFGDAVEKSVATTVADGNEGLVTSDAVYDYITTAVAGLAGAMHFKGAVSALPANFDGYVNGDVIVVVTYSTEEGHTDEIVASKEYVAWIPTEGLGHWIELGDETGHVLKSELGDLAYEDTGYVTINVAKGTGSIASLTPAGTVAVSVVDETDTDTSKVQIEGTNAASAVTITGLTKTAIKGVTADGVAPTLKAEGTDVTDVLYNASVENETLSFGVATFAPGSAATTAEIANVWTGADADVTMEAAAQAFTGKYVKAAFTGTAATDIGVAVDIEEKNIELTKGEIPTV